MNRKQYAYILKQLQQIKGFCGLGWGLKEVHNTVTNIPAWRVYVQKKLPYDQCSASQYIPAVIDGIATDVIERAATQITGMPPAAPPPGSLIANKKGIPGTMGCLAFLKTEQLYVFLTNYHVLFSGGARDNDIVWWVQKNREPPVYTRLGKTLYGKIGKVPYHENHYYIDCAIGSIEENKELPAACRLTNIMVTGTGEAQPGMIVTKTGFATGFSKGIIADIQYPDSAFINGIPYQAPNQVLIKPMKQQDDTGAPAVFSAQGDSGSVVLDEAHKVVGLLWGSNARGEGVASHIGPVVNELDIDLCTQTGNNISRRKKIMQTVYNIFKL